MDSYYGGQAVTFASAARVHVVLVEANGHQVEVLMSPLAAHRLSGDLLHAIGDAGVPIEALQMLGDLAAGS